METVRLTMNSARLTPIIDLPIALHNREVEVIVLPQLEEPKDRKPHSERKSMMGCLREYANPALREQQDEKSAESIKGILKHRANPALRELEKGAWEQAAVEKYLEKMKDDCA